MEKLIEVQWTGKGDITHYGDASVEYISYWDTISVCADDHNWCVEVINVYLPDGVPSHQQQQCKTQAIEEFHRTKT